MQHASRLFIAALMLPAISAFAAGLAGAPSVAGAQDASTLRVIISGVRHTNGKMNVCLWQTAAKFPFCDPRTVFKHAITQPVLGTTLVAFKDVPPGSYAVSITHDENGNGKLDRHWLFKYPSEGVGVSNLKQIIKRAPKFDEARFQVSGAHSEIGIRIFYPK